MQTLRRGGGDDEGEPRHRSWFLILLLLGTVGCKLRHDPAEDIDAGPPNAEQRAKLKAEMVAQAKPFADKKEYLLDDPWVVDACLDKALDFITKGNMPPPSRRNDVVWFGQICMSGESELDGGLQLLEKKIESTYEHPTITKQGSEAMCDVGFVSGNLRKATKGGWVIDSTPRIVENQWATSEIVRFFKMELAKYPDAKLYRLDVQVPQLGGTRYGKWTYVYDRTKVRIWDPNRYRGRGVATAEVPGGNLDAVPSLHTSKLKTDESTENPP